MAQKRPAGPRRRPKQDRSREIVRAIQQAGLTILDGEGPAALTTNRIAEVAGVSIGSLYRYYPNKEAIVADIYEERTQSEFEVFRDVERWCQALEEMPLPEAIRWIVQIAVARERRLLELDRDFYRRFNRQFVLGYRVGRPLRGQARRAAGGEPRLRLLPDGPRPGRHPARGRRRAPRVPVRRRVRRRAGRPLPALSGATFPRMRSGAGPGWGRRMTLGHLRLAR